MRDAMVCPPFKIFARVMVGTARSVRLCPPYMLPYQNEQVPLRSSASLTASASTTVGTGALTVR
jgi:hypothetical protein